MSGLNLEVQSLLALTKILHSLMIYYLHLTLEKFEDQEGEVTCLNPNSQEMAECKVDSRLPES